MTRFCIKIIIIIVAILFPTIGFSSSKAPDFAYPLTVSKDADKNLRRALKTGDGEATMRALIDWSIAQTLITKDNLSQVIKRIDDIIAKETNQATKALLNTLLANIYYNIYISDKWTYINRETPLTPLPDDFREWNARQFSLKILSLTEQALVNPETLQTTPLKDYKAIITAEDNSFIFYPTLYDFIVYNSIETLTGIIDLQANLSASWRNERGEQSFDNNSIKEYILRQYNNLSRFHINDIAAYINSETQHALFLTYIHQPEEAYRLLTNLYNNTQQSEYASLALFTITEIMTTSIEDKPAIKKWIYTELSRRLSQYPTFIYNCKIENILNTYSQIEISTNSSGNIVPGDSIAIHITNQNATRYHIIIHKIEDKFVNTSGFANLSDRQLSNPVDTITIDSPLDVPFKNDTTIYVTINTPGYYAVTSTFDGAPKQTQLRTTIIRCSNYHLSETSFKDNHAFYVNNPLTGKPISDVTIQFSTMPNGNSQPLLFPTDQSGCVNDFIPANNTSYLVSILDDNDHYSNTLTITGSNNQGTDAERNVIKAECFTSLPIYHLGDTVKWSAIIYNTGNNKTKRCPASDIQVNVTLHDANYQKINEAQATSDQYGRINGDFILPKQSLTGKFYITVSDASNEDFYEHHTFIVSDYKLPTFSADIIAIEKGVPTHGAITIKGVAKSFSGFPISNADVSLTLYSLNRIWWSFQSEEFYTLTTTTTSDGNFSFEIAAEALNNATFDSNLFNAVVTVTSITGETQETSKRFSNGTKYAILSPMNAEYIFNAEQPVIFEERVVDYNDTSIDTTLTFDIYKTINGNNSLLIKTGIFNTNRQEVDLSDIPSGNYTVKFHLNDSTLATPNVCELTIYRLSDSTPPSENILWLPKTSYEITSENSANIIYGTTAPNGYVLYTLYDNNNIIEQRWINTPSGIHSLNVSLPDTTTSATVSLFSTYKYNSEIQNITLRQKTIAPEISITAETFRDNIIPGGHETWSFQVSDNNGDGVEAAVLFDMYTKSIERIGGYNFKNDFFSLKSISQTRPTNYFTIFSPYSGRCHYQVASTIIQNRDCYDLQYPSFNTYGHSIVSGKPIRTFRRAGLLSSQAANITAYEVADAECDFAVSEAAATTLGAAIESKIAGVETSVGAIDSPNTDETFVYRNAETPLAFFRPMLTTDKDGKLTFSFIAPNANTTWVFKALAYTSDLLTTEFSRDILSNKPVMVQPNMPRFLRAGDKATILASVINNTDSVAIISTAIELFNPSTSEIITRYNQIDTIPANDRAIASIVVDTPYDKAMTGYRIKSSTATFADGEQSIIPILPSATPVIESTTFYIPSDTACFTMTLPHIPNNARVTLQFCENPTWYVVTALPGLRATEESTSTGAAGAIFSAAVAQGIIVNDKDISMAIHRWLASDKNDSTLTSMLERNQDLKITLLNATPWVTDAMSDTERMSRLALLFNKSDIDKTYNDNIDLLAKLQRQGGGWAWFERCNEASVWSTLNILGNFGRLKQLNYLRDDNRLNDMIKNAILFIDRYYAQEFTKRPKADYTNYVLVRSYFPDIKQSTAASRVTAAQIQQIISGWKKMSTVQKATAAIILNANGYNATAREILNSLREYALSSPQKGMWWSEVENSSYPTENAIAGSIILDAFNFVSPGCAEIAPIRQWLILQKEANNWGNSVGTTNAIASILLSGEKWTRPAENAMITIDANEVVPSVTESATGYFRTDISTLAPSGKPLTIIKPVGYPSWGSIISQYRQELSTIKAASSDAVSIEKHYYRQISGTDNWAIADSLSVGDRVKIQLVITAKQDMDYVSIIDERAACLEPVEQLPEPIFTEGIYFYRENRNSATNIFVTHLPKGTYIIDYETFVNNSGTYSSGIATLQSQYAPQMTAHSSGTILVVTPAIK